MSVHYQAIMRNRQKRIYDAFSLPRLRWCVCSPGSVSRTAGSSMDFSEAPWSVTQPPVPDVGRKVGFYLLVGPGKHGAAPLFSGLDGWTLVMQAALIQRGTGPLSLELPAVGDHGELFAHAIVVFLCSAGTLLLHRHELPWVAAAARQGESLKAIREASD